MHGSQPVWEGGTYDQEVKACFDIIRSHAETRAVLLSGVYAVDMACDFDSIFGCNADSHAICFNPLE